MGRSYWYECGRCGYRAKVSGQADRGLHLFVQTILCRDCKQLYDAVIRLRVSRDSLVATRPLIGTRPNSAGQVRADGPAPDFQSALNRLAYAGLRQAMWVQYPPRCPVSSRHRVQTWTEPDKCPRCGLYLEKNPLPYRIWD